MTKRKLLKFGRFEIDFQEKAQLEFGNGVRLSFELSDLEVGDEKTLSIMGEKISITKTADGYNLEVSGMSMFYPIGLQTQAS